MTGPKFKTLREHAGHVAYMFTDIVRVAEGADPIAIVKVSEEAREKSDVQDGLWMPEREATVVNWTVPGERAALFDRIEKSAKG